MLSLWEQKLEEDGRVQHRAMKEQAKRIAKLTAALQQISDMGPMSVDDQRWRIAREALTSAAPKAQLTPQQQISANVEPDPIYNRVGSPIQP